MLRPRIHAAAWIGVVGLLAAYYACDRQRRRAVAAGEERANQLRVRLGYALAVARRFRRERNMERAKAREVEAAFEGAVREWHRVNEEEAVCEAN